jgi:hypothetical protein
VRPLVEEYRIGKDDACRNAECRRHRL